MSSSDSQAPPPPASTTTDAAAPQAAAGSGRVVVPSLRAVACLMTRLRDQKTSPLRFKQTADRLMGLLAEEALAHLPTRPVAITTPTGNRFEGLESVDEDRVCLVSIIRAGDSLMEAARRAMPQAVVGKILIQRDESTPDKRPRLFYRKLPHDIASRPVVLCDPMLATGGSAITALQILIDQADVDPARLVFACVVAAPEGIRALHAAYPTVTVVAGAVDDRLNAEKYIVPGLGDYGDRYYGTV